MGSIDIPLFRSTQIYSIAEVHLTDVPDDGNQHALRVTMGPILSQNFFTRTESMSELDTVFVTAPNSIVASSPTMISFSMSANPGMTL